MLNENQTPEYHNNFAGVMLGVLVGGLAGAVTMLLLAPQTGKDTRDQIQKKGIELRDRTSSMMEDTMAQVRSNANKITIGGYKKAKEIKQEGQKLVIEGLDRAAALVEAGNKEARTS